MNCYRNQEINAHLIHQTQVCLGDAEVEYSLYRIQSLRDDYWSVEVCMGTEHSMQVLGQKLSYARKVYDMLALHGATPSALEDVLHDVKALVSDML